jgi:hypothetical protein
MDYRTEIYCPYCHEVFSEAGCTKFVTYWGEDGPQAATCQACGTDFVVHERVTRQLRPYESAPLCMDCREKPYWGGGNPPRASE